MDEKMRIFIIALLSGIGIGFGIGMILAGLQTKECISVLSGCVSMLETVTGSMGA